MGSTPSKHKNSTVRTKSEPQLRFAVNGHVPVRRAFSALSAQGTALPSDSFKLTKNSEDTQLEIPEEEYKDGQLGISNPKRIERKLRRLGNNELFCDEAFPADHNALFYSDRSESNILWKRPKDLVEEWQKPFLVQDGVTRDDIKQGILGDCWFLSACAAVSQRENFMKKIVPGDQPLFGEGYKGIVHFRFWRFGQYVDVYVDDRLPTIDGKLIYARSTDPTEFWVALIEKAYAKLHGSYEAIEGGQAMNALVDLTGGLAERHEVINKDPVLYRLVDRAILSGAFVACSRKGDWRLSTIADPNGLVSGHAYTITDIRKIKHERGEEKLVRIRNPWADNNEWKGSWSDNDVNWHWVDDETKKEIGLQLKDDGEFWMSYRDFCKHFQEVTICLMGPDFDGDGTADNCHVEMLKGEWFLGRTAGGSRNDLAMFSINPQYILTLSEPDDFDEMKDDPEREGLCTIVISLMQEHRRSKRNVKVKSLQIGFFLYKTEDPSQRLNIQHFRYNRDCGKSGVYINYREVSQRFELEPGHYVIIPSTFVIDESCFMLRVFGEKKFTLTGPKEDVPVQVNGHNTSNDGIRHTRLF
ncbi:calpain-A-like [Mizuhopecten yessoensis]|uniref:calpain-A-like n=1 Tax=Mizuhopecten yessoensis TaxID=6573 RepID=UPI000B45CDCA|nr:calpain-A-like [Mizuhopecten yessoensis]